MRSIKEHLLPALLILAVFALGFAVLTRFSGRYLPGWMTHNYFGFIWLAAILAALFGQKRFAGLLTAGCFAGILIGTATEPFWADRRLREIAALRQQGLTGAQIAEKTSGLPMPFQIWTVCLLLAAAAGILWEIKRRKKETHTNGTD